MEKRKTGDMTERHIGEECGVFGVFSEKRAELAGMVYCGLFALQHRGQESAGIVVNDRGLLSAYCDEGLLSEVFSPEKLSELGSGDIAVGHVRYATTGSDRKRNAQPIVVNHHKGCLALAHNGNLVNSYELRKELELRGSIFHTTTDSEIIAYIIVQERLAAPSIEEAVRLTMKKLVGAYSLVISSPAKLIAARDPHGFRPLCMGKTEDGRIVFASESCALDAVGAAFVRDILPGEIVTVSREGMTSDRRLCGSELKKLCSFEYIYFARPDSVIDGASVCLARQKAGSLLAKEHPVDADIVIGVPDSGLDAALGYSAASGIPYAIGFTKNKYIGRTFITPDSEQRRAGVGMKLNPVKSVIRGKRVVLIDDSIVRGTTCRGIIEMLRDAGASEIHMRVSAPPFIAPCFYGTDINSSDDLIASHHTAEEMASIIGVDSLGYLSIEDLELMAPECGGVCSACFSGDYPTETPSNRDKDRFGQKLIYK